ncbi:SPOR domain-containing protein [Porticoccaceae bacterium]|jgi:cell division protein FtsN|nr:SPOR domain-containing protein [Porticoccaceae bacterium]
MARDYPRKSATRSTQNQSKGSSSAPAFFAGMLVGALSMYLMPMVFDGTIPDTKAIAKAAEKVEIPDVKFSFHDMLKESEIVIPEDEQAKERAADRKNYSYSLQVGSFRNKPDAEGLRVKLLLLNLNASVETSGAGTGDVWHRVLVGPFANTSKTAAARAKLSQNDIDSLLVKRRL